jgi:hypothetical protein
VILTKQDGKSAFRTFFEKVRGTQGARNLCPFADPEREAIRISGGAEQLHFLKMEIRA